MILVHSRRAGERVLASVTRYLDRTLHLPVNLTKSAMDRLVRRTYLGFKFLKSRDQYRIGVAPEALRRVKRRLRELTDWHAPGRLEARIQAGSSPQSVCKSEFPPAALGGGLRWRGGGRGGRRG